MGGGSASGSPAWKLSAPADVPEAEADSSFQAWFISSPARFTSRETPCSTSRAASSNCVFIFLSSSSSIERFTSALTSAT